MPTSNGKIQQHWSNYCTQGYKGASWKCSSSSTPSDWEVGSGVAAKYNLLGSVVGHKGAIGQYVYVYVSNSVSKTVNVKFRYAHQVFAGQPGVSIFPAGLSITPSATTETLDYGIT